MVCNTIHMASIEQRSAAIAMRVAAEIARADRSQAWVAKRTGIPGTTLARKLKGLAQFTISDLLRIAEALAVSPSAFMTAELRGSETQSQLVGAGR
jgi:transcriptional regulator with XRE-family HTH domain